MELHQSCHTMKEFQDLYKHIESIPLATVTNARNIVETLSALPPAVCTQSIVMGVLLFNLFQFSVSVC